MTGVSVAAVAARLRQEKRIFITAHENPDGDALGCVVAMISLARRLGIDYVAYIPGYGPFPPGCSFLPYLEEIVRGPLPDLQEGTTAYVLDSASLGRLDCCELGQPGLTVNIDHHPDNPGYADLNLLDSTAASTTQILYQVFLAGDFLLDTEVATALYVGLVTDTGRFQYANTTAATHRMAAELQDLGVDVNAIYHQVYEQEPLPKVLLLARALSRIQVSLDGRFLVTWLLTTDFEELGAEESYTDGIIDTLRTVQGVSVAALLREQRRNGQMECRVSLRSNDGTVDVSSIAHLKDGGGHVQAAGFTTAETIESVAEWIEQAVRERL